MGADHILPEWAFNDLSEEEQRALIRDSERKLMLGLLIAMDNPRRRRHAEARMAELLEKWYGER